MLACNNPICGMLITWEEATDFEVTGDAVAYFCCPGCAARFREQERTGTGTGRKAREGRSAGTGPAARVGSLTLDDFEVLVLAQWRQTVGYAADRRCMARTVERAVLSLAFAAVDESERHRIEVLLAAEAARLRGDPLSQTRAATELEALPGVIDSSLRRTDASPGESARISRCAAAEIPPVLASLRQTANWRRIPVAAANPTPRTR